MPRQPTTKPPAGVKPEPLYTIPDKREGKPKRGQRGWKDPDLRRFSREAPDGFHGGGGIRGERF